MTFFDFDKHASEAKLMRAEAPQDVRRTKDYALCKSYLKRRE